MSGWFGAWSPTSERWTPLHGEFFYPDASLAAGHLYQARKSSTLPHPDDYQVHQVGADGRPVTPP